MTFECTTLTGLAKTQSQHPGIETSILWDRKLLKEDLVASQETNWEKLETDWKEGKYRKNKVF